LAVLSFSLGFFTPAFQRWWKQRHARQDSQRLFRRELESLLGQFSAVITHCDPKNGLLEGMGPSIFKESIERLTAAIARFEAKKEQLFDLRADELEEHLKKFYDELARFRDQLEKFARPWYPENLQPGTVWGPQLPYLQIQAFRSGAESK